MKSPDKSNIWPGFSDFRNLLDVGLCGMAAIHGF